MIPCLRLEWGKDKLFLNYLNALIEIYLQLHRVVELFAVIEFTLTTFKTKTL